MFSSLAAVATNGLASDFDLLKQKLDGRWTFFEDKEKYETTFEPISHGAALLERNAGFTVVYYPDGGSMMMTLFTKDGYQVRLRGHGIDQKSSSIDFAFQDATNLPAGATYINGLTLTFKDKDHIVEKWKMVDASGSQSSFDFELTRK